jgi:xanthine/uracil permease
MSGSGESGTYQRPANLTYALDERPPASKLLLLGLQYAVLDAFYLVLVAIIVRHSHATSEERIALMGISCVALAIGTVLQALPRGPVGSGFMAPPVFSATEVDPVSWTPDRLRSRSPRWPRQDCPMHLSSAAKW